MSIHLGVHCDRWSDFESLVRLARTAERGLFDFVLVGPESIAVLAALAAVTDRLGLVGMVDVVDTTSSEPLEVARRFVTLDHLSDGRAGLYVASPPGGEERTREFITVVRELWDGWRPGAVLADEQAGVYVDPARIHAIDHRGTYFDVRGVASLPARPQGHPVILRDNAFHHFTFDVGDAPERIADEMTSAARCDGFIVVPATPEGFDEFVDAVVPVLQERGVFRTEYEDSCWAAG